MILGLGGSSPVLGKKLRKSPEAEQEFDHINVDGVETMSLQGKGGKIRDWLAGLFQEYNETANFLSGGLSRGFWTMRLGRPDFSKRF